MAPPSSPSRPTRRVVVLTGGEPPHPATSRVVGDASFVVAADSGLHAAPRLGLRVDRLVGDLDSVEPAALERARREGVQIDRYPREKDRTDFAIALDLALEHGATDAVVVGGHGGRLDHLLGNVLLLAAPAYASMRVRAVMGAAVVHVVRRRTELRGRPGELVSLLPAHGVACGVRTAGLRWPLTGEDLPAGLSRGVSNEFDDPTATVDLDEGVLLVVQPGALDAVDEEERA